MCRYYIYIFDVVDTYNSSIGKNSIPVVQIYKVVIKKL